MNLSILLPVALCIASLILTIVLVRNGRPSLGLPVGYLYLLLLIHVPGALAHLVPDSGLEYKGYTETGIRYTAIGTLAFVAGLWLARRSGAKWQGVFQDPGLRFLRFCLIGGWIVTFGLRPVLMRIPSIGAAVENGGRVWLLAVMLAMPLCFFRRDWKGLLLWTAAMLVYPAIILVKGGFLSFGTTTTVLAFSLFAVQVRSWWRLLAGMAAASIVGISLFVTYFTIRDDIRGAVWGGRGVGESVEESTRIFREFKTFDSENEGHLKALNERLNQNVFVGMAAARLERGLVEYYRGRTVWEGVISLVPRAVWPGKPVKGGSPGIIREMTDFEVNKNTSWGVGNVMEFYINFGLPSLILGFVAFGWVLGKLDRSAAQAWLEGRVSRLITLFLMAVAIIRPEHSTVEMMGSAAGALVAALGWDWAWRTWGGGPPTVPHVRNPNLLPDRAAGESPRIREDQGDLGGPGRNEFRF